MPKHYTHLTDYKRCQIFALKQQKLSQNAIATAVGTTQSTISREFSPEMVEN